MRMTTRRRVGRLTSVNPAAANVLPGLGNHRVALERTCTALPPEVGGARERPAARQGDVTKAHVAGARLDRALADGLAVEIGNEGARRARLGVAAARLLAQPGGALLDG